MLGIFFGLVLTVTCATLGVTFFTTGAKLVTAGPWRVMGFESTVTWTGVTFAVPSDAWSILLNARPESPIARAATNVNGLKIFFFIHVNMPGAHDMKISGKLHLCNVGFVSCFRGWREMMRKYCEEACGNGYCHATRVIRIYRRSASRNPVLGRGRFDDREQRIDGRESWRSGHLEPGE
jgi:hypothetical protein